MIFPQHFEITGLFDLSLLITDPFDSFVPTTFTIVFFIVVEIAQKNEGQSFFVLLYMFIKYFHVVITEFFGISCFFYLD